MNSRMGNALWLFLSVPVWYFGAIVSPLSAGPLSAIPALGALFLAIGIVAGAAKREMRLLVFVLLLAGSQILVAVAGFLRGALRPDPNNLLLWIVGAFIFLQITGAAYIVWRLKGVRLPAAAMALFSSSYALFAAFVAIMAFTDDWI